MSQALAQNTLTDEERNEATAARQLRFLYRLALPGSIAHLLAALGLSAILYVRQPSTLVLGWSALMLVLCALMLGARSLFLRAEPDAGDLGTWRILATILALSLGAAWSLAAWMFLPLDPVAVATVVGAISLTGILALAAVPVATLAFGIPVLGTLIARWVLAGDWPVVVVGAILVALAICAYFASRVVRRAIRTSLDIAQEKAELAAQCTEAKLQLESTNNRLAAEAKAREEFESQVKNAQQTAEAASMAKDEFLATMSHEIRTPLNGILPLLDILRTTPLNDQQKDYVDTSFQSAKHLLRIIDDILDYSKVEAGKITLETVGINLRELLDSVQKTMEGSASRKGLSLVTEIEPGVRLAARGDPVRLKQVLMNLVSNAIKFTERGQVSVKISKRGESKRDTELMFAVRDTGVGIPKANQDKLFQPFSQADASVTRNYGGTGLGLAICARLVEAMGGQIGVKSEPGQGSVFWFTVRLKKALGDVDGPERTVNDAKIMLISADEDLQRRLDIFAKRWEAKLTSVSDATEAVDKVEGAQKLGEQWRFDAVIVDLTGEDLPTVVERLKADPELGVLLLNADGEVPTELAGGTIDARMRESSEAALRDSLENLLMGGDEEAEEDTTEDPYLDTADAGALQGQVLLVEDNPVNLHVAQKLLGLTGVSFDVAKNGKEALERLHAKDYDAVLMDCMMPVMDGYNATRSWREHEAQTGRNATPIIAMTANAMAGDRQKCLDAGMDDYMSKPLNRRLIVQTVSKWMQQGEAAAPAAAPPKKSKEPSTAELLAAAGPGDERVLDRQAVADMMDVMNDEFSDLVAVYLEDTPKTLRKLADAAAAGSLEGVIAAAHPLKSTSANLGARELAKLSREMEHDARQGEVPQLKRRVNAMIQAYKRVALELKKITDARV